MSKYYRLVTDPEEIAGLRTADEVIFKVPGVISLFDLGQESLLVPAGESAIFELTKQFDYIQKFWSTDDVNVALGMNNDLEVEPEDWTDEMKADAWAMVKERRDELENCEDAEWNVFHDAIESVMEDWRNGYYD